MSVGFGSTIDADPEEITTCVLRALRRAGLRGILLTGWGGIGDTDLPDEVFKTGEVPHDWLFGQVRAAVHHGRTGTTAASLRAGIPTVVVPFTPDQAFWGWRVEALGVGPELVPRKELSAERLAGAIGQATTDAGMGEHARLLGVRIRSEDGIGLAVEAFHRHVLRA